MRAFRGCELRIAASLLAAAALLSGAARADEYLVVLGAGAFDVGMPTDIEDTEPAYAAEFRFKQGLWHFHPHLGFQGTTDGMVYGFAGIHLDLPLGDRVRFVPSGSIGLYDHGDNGKDLDGLMEFRIGAGLAWRFANGWRVGPVWYHMSNAGMGHSNPGAEMMFLELGIPLP